MFLSSDTMAYLLGLGLSGEQTAELVWRLESDAQRCASMRNGRPSGPTAATYERAKQNDTAVHVYVMQAKNGDVKVGISQNPRWRARELSTEWRGKPAIAWTSAPRSRREALEIERNAHLILGEDRLDGEWFSCSPMRAIAAIGDAEGTAL